MGWEDFLRWSSERGEKPDEKDRFFWIDEEIVPKINYTAKKSFNNGLNQDVDKKTKLEIWIERIKKVSPIRVFEQHSEINPLEC